MSTIVEAMLCATRLSPAAVPDASPIEKSVADGCLRFRTNRGKGDLRTAAHAACAQERVLSMSARALRALERVQAA